MNSRLLVPLGNCRWNQLWEQNCHGDWCWPNWVVLNAEFQKHHQPEWRLNTKWNNFLLCQRAQNDFKHQLKKLRTTRNCNINASWKSSLHVTYRYNCNKAYIRELHFKELGTPVENRKLNNWNECLWSKIHSYYINGRRNCNKYVSVVPESIEYKL